MTTLADLGGNLFGTEPEQGVSFADLDRPARGLTLADIGRPAAVAPYSGFPLETSPQAQSVFNAIADHYAYGLRDLMTLPGRAFGTYGEPPTEEEMRAGAFGLALGMLGVGAPNAMTGATGALGGRLARPLPMDEASRMARAREMGFYTDMPLAHGTATEFNAFDSSKGASTSGGAPGRMGLWMEVHPEHGAGIADRFAETAAEKTHGNPQVMPLLHRSENPAALTLRGGETNHEIAATLAQAWDDGFTSVLLRNYTGHGGKSGDILVVKDPAQLRSPFAVFDPSKSHLADLLASLAIVPAAGVLGARSGDSE